MIQRIVLFQFPPATPQAEIDVCMTMLRELPPHIPEICRYDVAFNRQGREGRYQVSLLAQFDDEPALRRYEVHPAHDQFVRHIARHTSDVIVFDYDYD